MADTKVSALTADTTPSSDDLIYTVNDPGGTPASRKVTIANLAANMPAITAASVTSTGDDSLGNGALEIDQSAGNVGINVTPVAMLHVSKNYSTLPTGFNVNSDLLMLTRQNSSVVALLQASATSTASVYFGDSGNSRAAGFSYSNSTGIMSHTAESGFAFTNNSAFSTSVITPATLVHISSNYSTLPTGMLSNETLALISRQNGNVSLAINSGTTNDAKIFFGDSGDVDAGSIIYNNTTGDLSLAAETSITLADNVTASGDFNLASPTVPASAAATGTAGDIAWDTGYIYICTATDTWKRVAIATW